jgi:NADH:ubiquinone oxidoreductase subunit 6 (subunit J)
MMEAGTWSAVIFGVLSWGGALLSVGTRVPKRMAWGFSFCGISVGAVYLSLGFETLAFVQWFLTFILSLAFSVYSYLFVDEPKETSWKVIMRDQVIPGALVLLLSVIVTLGAHTAILAFSDFQRMEGVAAFGRRLIQEHLFAILLMGVILFLCIVGVGVLGRPEVKLKENS